MHWKTQAAYILFSFGIVLLYSEEHEDNSTGSSLMHLPDFDNHIYRATPLILFECFFEVSLPSIVIW